VFSILVIYYFQVFFNVKLILYVAKIPWLSSFKATVSNVVEKLRNASGSVFSVLTLKVAEHSFRACFCLCNSARAQGLQKTNMRWIERSFYLRNIHTICATFLYNWTQCVDGFSLLLQRYVRKGNDARNPAILSFFFVTERTQLNTAHAQ